MSDTSSTTPTKTDRPDLDETPPILDSWKNIYLLSLAWFTVLVVLFFLLTKAYNT